MIAPFGLYVVEESNRIESNHTYSLVTRKIRSDQIRSDQIRSDQIRSGSADKVCTVHYSPKSMLFHNLFVIHSIPNINACPKRYEFSGRV
jgi:hypothetical protein